jgi:hypothetical protein
MARRDDVAATAPGMRINKNRATAENFIEGALVQLVAADCGKHRQLRYMPLAAPNV